MVQNWSCFVHFVYPDRFWDAKNVEPVLRSQQIINLKDLSIDSKVQVVELEVRIIRTNSNCDLLFTRSDFYWNSLRGWWNRVQVRVRCHLVRAVHTCKQASLWLIISSNSCLNVTSFSSIPSWRVSEIAFSFLYTRSWG